MLIGKDVLIWEIKSSQGLPSFAIQMADDQTDVEEELVRSGWAAPIDNHPHLCNS
jgi:endonuclease YncB( thermonuclease family)